MAVALRRGHRAVGREGAILSAAGVPGPRLRRGESPFWTPNVFAGWPKVADPQSLIFSPLHVLLALLQPQPGFRAVDGVTFAALLAGGSAFSCCFRDRGWHVAGALVAALAFAFGGVCASRLQHTGQIISLAYFPLALWLLLARARPLSLALRRAAGLRGGAASCSGAIRSRC